MKPLIIVAAFWFLVGAMGIGLAVGTINTALAAYLGMAALGVLSLLWVIAVAEVNR